MSQNEIKTIYDVLIADIEVGERKRSINSEKVTALIQSIEAIGLQTPITVYGPDHQKPCTLVAGLHRLEAIKRLGRDAIPAFFMDAGEADREIWEIDENLQRADLTALERDEHLARRAELFDAKGGEKIATPGGKQKIGFAKDTADKTGLSKSTINKALSRNRKIAPDVKKLIKEIRPDAGVSEIEALASLMPDDQRQAAQDVKSGLARNFTDAVAEIQLDQKREEKFRISEAFDKLVDRAEKSGELRGRALSNLKWNFKDDIKGRIVALKIDAKGLAKLGHLFYEVLDNPDHLVTNVQDKMAYVYEALDLVEAKESTVAKAVDLLLAPLRKERRKRDELRKRVQAERAEEKERKWQETEPFEHLAEFLCDGLDIKALYGEDYCTLMSLRRHLKNCGLTKLEAAVEKYLAEAEAKDAA